MRRMLPLALALAQGLSLAQAPTLADPWLPPAARQAPLAPPTRGQALRAQVQAKLATQFQQADVRRRGALTLAEARAAGFGWLVQHFARIDGSGRGEVSLAEVQAYLLRQQSL